MRAGYASQFLTEDEFRGSERERESMSLIECLSCSSIGAPPAPNTDPMFWGRCDTECSIATVWR